MQLAAFVLSLTGVVLAALSLGWNVAQWLLTGARPRVELVIGPVADDLDRAMARLAHEGFTRPVIGVKVVNHGRAPARVERWALKCNGGLGLSYTPITDSYGPDLPHDLPAGASTTWVTDLQNGCALGRTTVPDGARPAPVAATAELGTGRL